MLQKNHFSFLHFDLGAAVRSILGSTVGSILGSIVSSILGSIVGSTLHPGLYSALQCSPSSPRKLKSGRALRSFSLLLLITLVSAIGVKAQPEYTIQLDQTELELRTLASDLVLPWDLVWGPDDWIWFTQREGAIRRLNPETGEIVLVDSLTQVFNSWDNSGLHALALHPDFENKPWLYVNYTWDDFDGRLSRFTYDTVSGHLSDETILLEFEGNESHNGARLIWLPDTSLLFSMGDAYNLSAPQNLESLNGKVLRLLDDGSIPADNPWPDSYVWTYGHRNPQGLTRSTRDGKIYSSEHGTDIDDEINWIRQGKNYGWPLVWGYCDEEWELPVCDSTEITEPLKNFSPTAAPSGMTYYDHPAIPEWRHALLVGFLKRWGPPGQRIKVLKLSEDGERITDTWDYLTGDTLVGAYGRIRDVMTSPDGRVFFCTSNREFNGIHAEREGDDRIVEIRNPKYVAEPLFDASDEFALLAYPNPVSDRLFVRLNTLDKLLEFHLFDSNGREFLETHFVVNGNTVQLPVENLANGIYLLQIRFVEAGQTRSVRFKVVSGTTSP